MALNVITLLVDVSLSFLMKIYILLKSDIFPAMNK